LKDTSKKITMDYIKSLFLIIFILLSAKALPQIYRCGTELTDLQRTYEMNFTDSVHSLSDINRTLHVSLFIVKDKEGETNMEMSDFNAAFSGLNNAFSEIKLVFSLSSLNYIDNYHFNTLRKKENESDMVAQNFIPATINIYLVNHLFDSNDQEVCGYTYYPAEKKDIILFSKSCIDEEFMIEQFGHFFNLYHTHEQGFAEELADGSNCAGSGDLCCDTPADPDLTGKVTPDCQYVSTEKDANGQYYVPSVFNYMSYSPGECGKCFFSTEQYMRIINCILKTKSHLR
jgi:hypothetical protein